MNRLRRLLVPSILACALLGAFAASASAEVRTGEGSSPADPSLAGEADLLHATASYDSRTGTVVFEATAREAPGPKPAVGVRAGLATVKGPCDSSIVGSEERGYPSLFVSTAYDETRSPAGWVTGWGAVESEAAPGPEDQGPATRSLEGTTTTIAATAPPAIGKPYNCALVMLASPTNPETSEEVLLFPISVPKPTEPPQAPEPVVKTVTVTTPAPAPAPTAPGKLAIAKSKALSATSGKWVKASVKITNTGGTAVGPLAIKATSPAGITVGQAQIKVPALLPGQSWAVAFRLKPTAGAKATSTVGLTASGPGLDAKGSLTLKLKG